MTISINGKEYDLYFGIGFVKELNEIYFQKDASGKKWGLGLEVTLPSILTYDPIALSEYLYVATSTAKPRPKREEIDQFIDECDLDAVFEEVIEELKKQNATKKNLEETTRFLEEQKELQEKQKEAQEKSTRA